MNLELVLPLVGGLIGLVVGGELLVRGAGRLATAIGISPLVIGLTVVAFGTSAPEMAVSVSAVLAGQPDIAAANVIGSNIFNVLFILGVCALATPLVVSARLVRVEVPLLIAVSTATMLLANDGRISRLEGLALFAGLLVYTVWAVRDSRRETAAVQAEFAREFGPDARPEAVHGAGRPGVLGLAGAALQVIGGLVVLVFGARMFVAGAIALARMIGVDEVVIGLTVVAAGTSLPEVAASVIATIRGERDIAIGNVIGSNLFNLLGILGVAAVVGPGGLVVAPSLRALDLPVMVAVAVACLPLFFTGFAIARWEGGLFLAMYVAYTAYLVLASTRHAALPAFSATMLEFVLPILVVTIAVLVIRSLRGDGSGTAAR
jgi:cation:H+ antiporter